jgi:hypothetical protein
MTPKKARSARRRLAQSTVVVVVGDWRVNVVLAKAFVAKMRDDERAFR